MGSVVCITYSILMVLVCLIHMDNCSKFKAWNDENPTNPHLILGIDAHKTAPEAYAPKDTPWCIYPSCIPENPHGCFYWDGIEDLAYGVQFGLLGVVILYRQVRLLFPRERASVCFRVRM